MTVTDTPSTQGRPITPAAAGRLPELDIIRVVASAAVVLWHYTFSGWASVDPPTHVRFVGLSQVVRYGFVAPQLFFFVSGFVIIGVAQTSTARSFLRARALRIVPLFWVICTITYLASRHHPPIGPISPATYGLNMSFLVSIVGGHFVDAVYWTLTVEIAFYGIVWLMVAARQTHRLRPLLVAWLLAGLAIEAVGRGHGASLDHLAFLMRWNCCFAAGICCWFIRQDRHDRFAWGVLGACVPLIARAVWLVAADFQAHLQPGVSLHGWIGALLALGGLALVLWLCLTRPAGGSLTPAAARRWAALGGLTYPVYLLHENVGLILMDRFDWVDRWILLAGTIAVVVAASWALLIWFERPVIAWLKRRIPA